MSVLIHQSCRIKFLSIISLILLILHLIIILSNVVINTLRCYLRSLLRNLILLRSLLCKSCSCSKWIRNNILCMRHLMTLHLPHVSISVFELVVLLIIHIFVIEVFFFVQKYILGCIFEYLIICTHQCSIAFLPIIGLFWIRLTHCIFLRTLWILHVKI